MASYIFEHMARRRQQPRVDKFIALLELYLYEQADVPMPYNEHLISAHRVLASELEAVADKNTRSELPASLGVCPNVSLKSCLEDYSKERKLRDDLLAALYQDKKLVQMVHDYIGAEYAKIPPESRNGDFEAITDLPLKLAHLRNTQQAAVEAQEKKNKFRVEIVERLNGDGTVAWTEPIMTSLDSQWPQFRASLKVLGTEEDGNAQERPGISKIVRGKWMYQLVKENDVPETKIHDLLNKSHYETMRTVAKDPNVRVLVWHEKVWEESKKAKRDADEVREWGFEEWADGSMEFGGDLDEKNAIHEDLGQLEESGKKAWADFMAGCVPDEVDDKN